jgi:hypothetical protein
MAGTTHASRLLLAIEVCQACSRYLAMTCHRVDQSVMLLKFVDSYCLVMCCSVLLFSVLRHVAVKVLNTSQVQGVMRRGVTAYGLQEFVLAQRMSKAKQ